MKIFSKIILLSVGLLSLNMAFASACDGALIYIMNAAKYPITVEKPNYTSGTLGMGSQSFSLPHTLQPSQWMFLVASTYNDKASGSLPVEMPINGNTSDMTSDYLHYYFDAYEDNCSASGETTFSEPSKESGYAANSNDTGTGGGEGNASKIGLLISSL